MAEALEQPLFLPKDLDAARKLKRHELFMSLKKDLAMVSSQPYTFIYLSVNRFSLLLT